MATPWGDLPAPLLDSRFLYQRVDSLNDLSSASTSNTAKTPSFWRAFSDQENERLLDQWVQLNPEAQYKALRARNKGYDSTKPISEEVGVAVDGQEKDKEREALEISLGSPDYDLKPHQVPVGPDMLWTVELLTLECISTFWTQPHVPVQLATWFLPPTQAGKYQMLDFTTAEKVEAAYQRIGSWHPSYGDELASAVMLGEEAEQKLKVELDDNLDCIFQGPNSARLYTKGVASRLSKSVLTTFLSRGQHGGGQFVLRGYEAVRNYEIVNHIGSRTPARAASPNKSSRPASPAKSEVRDRRQSTSGSPAKTTGAAEKLAKLLSYKKAISPHEISHAGSENIGQPEDSAKVMESAEAPEIASTELTDLVLVIHGIGQKLSDKYTSFSFVHAVNQLRANANKHFSEPKFETLAHGKRVQFLPIRWRLDLNLEEGSMDKSSDTANENLDNSFSMSDIEPEGIPFVREMISNVLLDIPHYLSHHRPKLIKALVKDVNRVYRLFEKRNPGFNRKGKTHIVAHSLGCALSVDVLSVQPTHVPFLDEMPLGDLQRMEHFCFNTTNCFFLGSPAAFFYFLNGAQLIARKGRARTAAASADVALDRTRYGCLSVDSLYNIYSVTDPVAYCLNPVVDATYAKEKLPPAPVAAQTKSTLDSVSESVSKLFEHVTFPKSLWVTTSTNEPSQEVDIKEKMPEKLVVDLEESEADRRAKSRFLALNPLGNIDFYLEDDSSIFGAYYSLFLSHASYWSDVRVSSFILTQLFSSAEQLAIAKTKAESPIEEIAPKI